MVKKLIMKYSLNKMAFVHYEKDELLELLKPYFLLGMSIHKACATSGLCDDQTILNWCEDVEIRKKIESWQNYLSAKARNVVADKINQGSVEDSWKWLERKEKQEFSPKSEVENTGEINIKIIE